MRKKKSELKKLIKQIKWHNKTWTTLEF